MFSRDNMEKSKFVMPRLSHNRSQHVAIADSETENLNLHLARPWEIAYALAKGNEIYKTRCLYPWYPDLNVSPMAAKITGFKWEKYKDLAIPKEEVWEEIKSVIYDEKFLIVGHNFIGFDIFMIRRLALDCGDWCGWSYINRVIDTLCWSRMYHNGERPDPNNNLGSLVRQLGKPPRGSKKSTLSAMADVFKIPYEKEKLHSAEYDLTLNFQVFNKLVYALDI